MTARRQARDHRPARVEIPRAKEQLPAAFRLGACAEVWAAAVTDGMPGRAVPRYRSARDRFRAAWSWWRRTHILPNGAGPAAGFWTLDDTSAPEHLAAAGCGLDELPTLRRQAERLFLRAHPEQLATPDDRPTTTEVPR